MLTEQVDQADLLAVLVEEAVVPGNRARRQLPALLGDALDLAAQLDLLGQQLTPRLAVLGALVGIALAAPGGKLSGGGECLRLGHDVSPCETVEHGLEPMLSLPLPPGNRGSGRVHRMSWQRHLVVERPARTSTHPVTVFGSARHRVLWWPCGLPAASADELSYEEMQVTQ